MTPDEFMKLARQQQVAASRIKSALEADYDADGIASKINSIAFDTAPQSLFVGMTLVALCIGQDTSPSLQPAATLAIFQIISEMVAEFGKEQEAADTIGPTAGNA